jgi:hypothetical protein
MPKRKGTSFAEDRIVKGDCESPECGETDVLLYAYPSDDLLLCPGCARKRALANPTKQPCDNCGSTGNVWRDPVHRRNEYLCIKCHDPESLFQNRWANKVRESKPLGMRARVTCALADRGTECKGEIKWRSALSMSVCNKHAGKPGVGPNG